MIDQATFQVNEGLKVASSRDLMGVVEGIEVLDSL